MNTRITSTVYAVFLAALAVLDLTVAQTVSPLDQKIISETHNESKLYRDLFKGYENTVRPASSPNVTVEVEFGVALIQILYLDEAVNALAAQVFLRKKWRDPRLTWNPDEYGGVSSLRVKSSDVWKPDIILYNSHGEDYRMLFDAKAILDNNGYILWIPTANLVSQCPLDLTKFPFDSQTCNLKFGSWTYDGNHLALKPFAMDHKRAADLFSYFPHSEWELTNFTSEINVIYYPCCDSPYPDMTFTLKFERKSIFFTNMMVLPCALLLFLVPLTFLLPPGSGEKMTLGSTILLTIFVQLVILMDMPLPTHAEKMPVLGVFYILTLILASLSLLVQILTQNCQYRGPRRGKVPQMLKKILLTGLNRILCVSDDSPSSPTEGEEEQALTENSGKDDSVVSKDVRNLLNQNKQRAACEDVLNEWHKVAIVLDRLFCIAFLVIAVIATIAILA